jgi:anti-sigma B factor antagonist
MGDQVAETSPVVVMLPAEIDVTNSEVAFGLLVAALTPGVHLVIADLTATSFCDTSGIRALAHAQEQIEARNARLRLAIPPGGSVHRVLELTGVIGLLDVYPGLDEAVSG